MNSETCERMYNAHYMRVFSYVMTMAGDRHLAEEVSQETFYRAFAKSAAFRNESDEVTWLCAIAKNCFLDEQRRRGKTAPMPEELPAGDEKGIELDTEDKDSSFRIHVALHSMEEPYKEIFELRVFGELSFQQIGTIFGKTENWARVTYHRARLKLQERMNDHEI